MLSVHLFQSACDYWSLGVIAFELVTLNRPFSSGDDDSTAQILSNIQKFVYFYILNNLKLY